MASFFFERSRHVPSHFARSAALMPRGLSLLWSRWQRGTAGTEPQSQAHSESASRRPRDGGRFLSSQSSSASQSAPPTPTPLQGPAAAASAPAAAASAFSASAAAPALPAPASAAASRAPDVPPLDAQRIDGIVAALHRVVPICPFDQPPSADEVARDPEPDPEDAWDDAVDGVGHGPRRRRNNGRSFKIGLPLQLARAVTVHRIQGATLDAALVTLGSREYAGVTLTALSRGTLPTSLILYPPDDEARLVTRVNKGGLGPQGTKPPQQVLAQVQQLHDATRARIRAQQHTRLRNVVVPA